LHWAVQGKTRISWFAASKSVGHLLSKAPAVCVQFWHRKTTGLPIDAKIFKMFTIL
jgi:hypothetical protein